MTEGISGLAGQVEGEGVRAEPNELPLGSSFDSIRRRAPRLSAEDVFEAADGLLLKGTRVTIDRVRQQLGRGSPNTIQEYLETWWAGLGGRVRGIPGQELPQLPAALSAQILKLWNTALDTSRESLLTALEAREAEIESRESALTEREKTLNERSEVIEARLQSHSDAATLAREQLLVANQRAEALESVLKSRESEYARLQERAAILEKDLSAARTKQEVAAAAHETQKIRLEGRYEANEARWLQEVDRARQALKAAAHAHNQAAKDSLRRTEALEKSRAQLTRELSQVRAELKAATKAKQTGKSVSKTSKRTLPAEGSIGRPRRH